MRILFYFLILSISIVTFSQKKKKQDVVIPQSQTDSLNLEGVLIEAEKQLILENYEKALENFKTAQSLNTQSAAINFKIAETLSNLGQGQQAIPYALESVALERENKFYQLFLGRLYKSIGFYIDASKVYEQLIDQYPMDGNVLYEAAELYQQMGQIEDMFRVFDKIESVNGVQEQIVRERQRILMMNRDIDGVIAEYQKLTNAYPNNSTYAFEYLNFLIHNRRLDLATQELTKFESKKTLNSRVVLLKSQLEWNKGNRNEAIQLLSQALSTSTIEFEDKFHILSTYYESANQKERQLLSDVSIELANQYHEEYRVQAFAGDLLYQAQQPEKALNYYLRAIELSPSNFSIWQNIINISGEKENYDDMIEYSEQALEYFPNQALLYYFAGTGYLVKKNYSRSVSMLDHGKRLTKDPSLLSYIYGQLGDAHNGTNNNTKSYEAYEKALMNNPNNDHVLNNYSYFLSLDGVSLDKALKMSTKLVNQHPENPTYLDTHGWVLYVMQRYKDAKKYLEKAALLGNDGTVLEHYGDVLFQLGDKELAMEQWERAAKIGGASELIEQKIADRKLYE